MNILWTGANLTLANIGSWTMKEGIVFSGVSLTDHGLKLIGVDVSELEQPYKGLSKAAEYSFSICTTMGILGVTNQYTSYIGSTGAALINQGFGYDLIAGATNPGARIVQDNALVIINFAQQWIRGSYLIERGQFGGDEVSTWFRPDEPWAAMAPDGAMASFLVGIVSQLYLEWRDRDTGGLTYPDMKAVKGLWESIKEKVLKKAGGEVNRIPAALQHELMGEWAFAIPVLLVEALQAFLYSVMKDEDCPIWATAILCGFLYGYASGVRGATRNEARRADEMTQGALEDRIRTAKSGTWARFDAIRELLRHFKERTDGILRSRNFPLVALSLVYPAMETMVTQAMVTYSVMKYPNALENLYPGYRPSESHLELAGRVLPGFLTGTVMITFHHFLIPAKHPILAKAENGQPAPTGERNAPISLAEAYTQTTQVAVGVGAINAFMDTGAEGLLVGVGMTYLSMLLTSSVLTKRSPVITEDKMPPTPDLVEEPQRPGPRGCRFFRGYENFQRLREQMSNLRASRRPRVDGPPVVIHARPVPGQADPRISQQANGHLDVLAGVTPGNAQDAMQELRDLIWEDADQIDNLGAYIDMYATSGPNLSDSEVALRYVAIVQSISSFGAARDQFQQEVLDHADRNARSVPVLADSLTSDQLAMFLQAGFEDVLVQAPRSSSATPTGARAPVPPEIEALLREFASSRDLGELQRIAEALQQMQINGEPVPSRIREDVENFLSQNDPRLADGLVANISSVWPANNSHPIVATIYDSAMNVKAQRPLAASGGSSTQEQFQILASLQNAQRVPVVPLGDRVPLPTQSPIEAVITSQPVRSVTDRAIHFSDSGNEVQVYRNGNSIRAYLPNDALMVAFELEGGNVVAIRGVPALYESDLDILARMGLISSTSYESLQLPLSIVSSSSSSSSNAAPSQVRSTVFSFAGGSHGSITIEPGHIDISYVPAAQGSQAPGQMEMWRVDLRNLRLMQDVLATRDSSYLDLDRLELAEQLTQSFAPDELIGLLQSGYVPMEQLGVKAANI